jgi:hypothetical protein
VEAALQRRLSSWAELIDLNIMCMTWNVAGSAPTKPEHFALLAQLVQLHDASLVALAFQEAVDLGAATLGIATVTQHTHAAIEAFLQVSAGGACLSLQQVTCDCWQAVGCDTFTCISAQQLVGVVLAVIARHSIAPLCRVHATAAVPCGIMNAAGNKGGVTCSVAVLDTRIAFVAAHLAGAPPRHLPLCFGSLKHSPRPQLAKATSTVAPLISSLY